MTSCIVFYIAFLLFNHIKTVHRKNMRSAGASKLAAFTHFKLSILFGTLTVCFCTLKLARNQPSMRPNDINVNVFYQVFKRY